MTIDKIYAQTNAADSSIAHTRRKGNVLNRRQEQGRNRKEKTDRMRIQKARLEVRL